MTVTEESFTTVFCYGASVNYNGEIIQNMDIWICGFRVVTLHKVGERHEQNPLGRTNDGIFNVER